MHYSIFNIGYRFIIIIVLLLSATNLSIGQEISNANYSVEQLDNTKGLSNSSVNTIFQDSENLLWIGTFDGLNRYDGKNFKIFRPELNNENSLSNQVILEVNEDETGLIWILTTSGIDSYHKKTNTFKRHFFSSRNKFTLSEGEFNMAIDYSKKVFCAVKNWGFGYFNGKEFQKIGTRDFPMEDVRTMEFLPSGELLLLFENNDLYSLTIGSNDNGVKNISNVKKIATTILNFSVLKSKIVYTTSSGKVFLHSLIDGSVLDLGIKNVQNIIKISLEKVILNTNNENYLVNNFGQVLHQEWLEFLENKKVNVFQLGNENIIWVGTDGDAVLKIYQNKKTFNTVSEKQAPEFDGGIIRAFSRVKEKAFFVGTKSKGLFRFSPNFHLNPNTSLKYENFNESNSSINNSVYTLCNGQDDFVYIGTDGDGVSIYDMKSSKLVDWSEVLGNEECAYFKSTYAIYQDEMGYVWVGTSGYGLIRFKIERSGEKLRVVQFKNYLARKGEKGFLSSNIIYSIVPKNRNKLWVGTRLGGLNLFDIETGLFETYMNNPNDINSLSNNDILSLYYDPDNRLWIGTSFGLELLEDVVNDTLPVFKKFTVKDGLPNNTIHGIIPGEKSTLWISTNFGLSSFNINEKKFINFTKQDGLQNNEYADGAYYLDKTTGYVFMGGIKGFNYFLPSKIEESIVIPDILIDKISGQNQKNPYFQGLVISPDSKSNHSIVLDYNQNFFDIDLSAITFIGNEKCQYEYQLKNFDTDWNVISNRRIISFTNVPQGNYSLWIKWSNSDGVWTNPVRAIDIKIKPIFWRSNVAIIIYILLIFLFILFVLSYYKKQQLLRQNIIFQKRDEEIHQNRLTFFTNIAHEFQTPLTLIIGPIQKLSETTNFNEKNQKFIRMIQRNSSRLLFLTQQLLEFRKAEYDHLEVAVKKFDLINLVEQIAELFDEWALEKNIEYSLDLPPELIGWFDKDKVEKIVFNLLSNAFKYTPENGKIKLHFFVYETEMKILNIKVSNSGKRIPKEKLGSLFNRYFMSDGSKVSNSDILRTGIGLAYVKKLVTVLKGDISVSSTTNKLTTFTVNIPCGKEKFNEKELELDKESSPILISHHLKNIIDGVSNNKEHVPNKISLLEAQIDKRKIVLIVEDEKEIQLFLNELLKDKYKVVIANNGIEALETIKNEIPDIIISDVMMPHMDGIEFCKQIKGDLNTFHIPFIMLTAKDSIIHRIEGLESGANSYIPKPFYPDHILVRVQKLLEEKELLLKHLSQDSFFENLTNLPVDKEDNEFIKKLVELIRTNIENENLHSLFIEKKLGISSSQLYRKVKQLFDLSPGDLIRTIRLKHAAELLQNSSLTVSQVCYQSGFNNRSYFYREFKKMYDSTPKNYQLKHKPNAKY